MAIHPGGSGYEYLGCYNETLDITNDRAIYGGKFIGESDGLKEDEMTVQKCLQGCKGASQGGYNVCRSRLGMINSVELNMFG